MDYISDCSSSSKPRKWKWFKNEKDKECDKIESLANSIVKMSDIIDQMDKKTVVVDISKEKGTELKEEPDVAGLHTNNDEVSSDENVEMIELASGEKETSSNINVNQNVNTGLDTPLANDLEEARIAGKNVEETLENGDDLSEKVEKLNVNDCEEVSIGLNESFNIDKCSLCRLEQVHECEQVEELQEEVKINGDIPFAPKEDCPPELVSLMKELLSKYKAGSESQTNVSMKADPESSYSATSESKISQDENTRLTDNSVSLDQDSDPQDEVSAKVDIESGCNMTDPLEKTICLQEEDLYCAEDSSPGLETITELQGKDNINGPLDDTSCSTNIGCAPFSSIPTKATKSLDISSQQDVTRPDNKECVKDLCDISVPQADLNHPVVTILQEESVSKEQDDCFPEDLSLNQQQIGSNDSVTEKQDTAKADEPTKGGIESPIDESKSVESSQELDKIEDNKVTPYNLGKDRLELYLDFVKLWCEVHTGEAAQVKKEANIMWKEKLQKGDSVSVLDYMEQMSILRSRQRQQKYGDSLPDCLDVEFVCSGSESCVKVAGSFNDWIPESLTENSSGEWTGAFSLAPGDYLYKYIVEGEWVVDPTREVIIDDAGIENNRIVVEDRVTKCIREILESRANISTELSLPWKAASTLGLCPK